MAGTGGSGISEPPGDGEHVAPVIPLRQRQPATAPRPAAAGKRLARENAAFDPEPERGSVVLRQRRSRRAATAITRVLAPRRPGSWRLSRRTGLPVLTAGVVLAAAVIALPLLDSTRPPSPARSHAVQHRSATIAGTEPIGPAVAETPSTTRQTPARRVRHPVRHRTRVQLTKRHVTKRALPAFEQVSDVTTRAAITPTVAASTSPPATPQADSGSPSTGATAAATHSSSAARSSGPTPAFGPGGALGPGSSPRS